MSELVGIGHQICHTAFECLGQLLDSGNSDVALPALDHAYECAVKVCVEAEGFL